ncbi:hypothetical protein PIB30_056308 [Stylosanthes scabra]|uniref:Ubiquitin-like protease family profile domain-containing protein n=1 Tax=Stylosanthes scabra TaxID=79078 RepID=A0ABU6QIZ8_9FABA|nr:hypothetical protein [Stylosanthes scabra]
MDYIINMYMGKADELMMIYVPIHIRNHWFFMIVDVWDTSLVYLDSLRSDDAEETALRISMMTEVAHYLGGMLQSASLWKNEETLRPFVGEFEPKIPTNTGQQAPGTMDCGVWVCQWMMNSHLWLDYSLEDINEATRMSIVVELVTSKHNPLAKVVADRAVNFWDQEMLRHHKEGMRRKGRRASPST